MLLYLTLCLSFLVIQEERVETKSDRVAPAHFRRKAKETFEIKTPKLLEEKDLVVEPDEILKNLRDIQQKAWVARKGIKGKAWTNFIGSNEDLSTVVLLEFSVQTDPHQTKFLAYYLKRKQGDPIKPFHELATDDKDQLMCIQASIRSPKMLATGMFMTQFPKGKGSDRISIYPPEKQIGTFANVFDDDMFQYAGSPKLFFDQELPEKTKLRYRMQVKKRGELVELSLWHKNFKDRPTDLWLFDLSKNGCCVYRYTWVSVIETEFVSEGEHWIPKRMTMREDRSYHETKFFDIVVNPIFEKTEYSVSTFPCSDNGMVDNKIKGGRSRFRDFKSNEK